MLYYLFRFFDTLGIPGSGMWSYVSFRALMAFMVALLFSWLFGKLFISYMNKHKDKYEEKKNDKLVVTNEKEQEYKPSMGGIVIIVALVLACLLFGRLRNVYLLLMMASTIWLGLTGFYDDYLKVKRSKNGLAPKWKLVSQFGLGIVVAFTLYLSPDAVIHENIVSQRTKSGTEIVYKSKPVKSTITTIPFVKSHNFDYARFGSSLIGWSVFVIVTIFFIMLTSNGLNLNDGLDGMAAGNSAIIFSALGVLAYVSSHIGLASYLNIMYIPGTQELVVYTFALIGALVGFLWHNASPAKMIMGDTGSLAIGGAIAVLAVIIHKEIMLFLLCALLIVELISSKSQTWYSVWGTKHGRKQRLFKRAPLHDAFRKACHFEEGIKYKFRWCSGNEEDQKVTVHFWIISILLAALTIISLKIR